MILDASKYTNLKTNSVIKNKIKSINLVFDKTAIMERAKIKNYNKSDFTQPTTVNTWNYVKQSSGSKTEERGEITIFKIDKTYTFENPINKIDSEITYNTTYHYYNVSKYPDFGTQLGPNYSELNYGTNASIITRNNITNFSSTEEVHYLPKTGIINKHTITTIPNSGNGFTVSMPVVEKLNDYQIRVKATIPVYTAIMNGTYVKAIPVLQQKEAYNKIGDIWILNSINIDIYAQTVATVEVPFNSGNEKPALEIPKNELMQYESTVNNKLLAHYMADTIISKQLNGRQIITLDIVDEELPIEIGTRFQVKDAFGNFIKNGNEFEVYSIYTKVGASCIRTIKLMEVK